MAAYRGVDLSQPIDAQVEVHEEAVASASVEVSSSVADTRLLLFAAVRAASAGADPAPGMAERYEAYAATRTAQMADEARGLSGAVTRTVTVEDDAGGEVFLLAVALRPESAPSAPPTVEPLANRLDFEGDAVDLQVAASDPDGDPLTYEAEGLPPGLSIEGDGRITGSIGGSAASGSPYQVTVSVSDLDNPAVEESFTWTVRPSSGSIALVGSTSYSSEDDVVTSFAVEVPSGTEEGDFLVMSMFHGASPDPVITAPAGWSELYQNQSSNGGKHTVYYKFAGGAEPAFYTWQLSEPKHPAAGMIAYRGVDDSTPVDAFADVHEVGVASASIEVEPMSDATRLLVFAAVKATDGGATQAPGMAERYERYAVTRTAQMADEALGSSGPVTRALSVDDDAGGEVFLLAVALRPAMSSVVALGDPSDDGNVSPHDASITLRHWAEIESIDESLLPAADVSDDGSVTPFDASLILRYWAQLIDCFPAAPDCEAGKQGDVARGTLAFDGAESDSDVYALPISLSAVSGTVTSVAVEVELLPGMRVDRIDAPLVDDLPGGRLLVHHTSGSVLRIGLIGAEPFDAGRLLTIFLKSDGPPSGLIARGVVNETTAQQFVSTFPEEQPQRFSLLQNYPNPFNPTTTIRYELAQPERVLLEVFDALGRKVAILIDAHQEAGEHSVDWNATNELSHLSSGTYVYRLQAGEHVASRTMTLLK
jgi:hypothetical protein